MLDSANASERRKEGGEQWYPRCRHPAKHDKNVALGRDITQSPLSIGGISFYFYKRSCAAFTHDQQSRPVIGRVRLSTVLAMVGEPSN